MAFKANKFWVLCLVLLLGLPACGGFRSGSGSKAETSQKAKKKSKKKDPQLAKKVGRKYFIWPAAGAVTSPYGVRHGRMHDGIDIDGETGDIIMAAASGEVVFSGTLGGYGKLIVIKHPNGLFTAYAHNSKNLKDKGDKVKRGQKIAKMGATGHATGDHLHFEIRADDGTHDPLDFLPRSQYASTK